MPEILTSRMPIVFSRGAPRVIYVVTRHRTSLLSERTHCFNGQRLTGPFRIFDHIVTCGASPIANRCIIAPQPGTSPSQSRQERPTEPTKENAALDYKQPRDREERRGKERREKKNVQDVEG